MGNLLLQQESCEDVPRLPLEILVAQTEGQIGYMIEATLDSELMELGIDYRPLVSLLTYVVVDKNDPGFANPTKPIGPSFTKERAAEMPYPTVETPKGYRRVVASPRPVTIIEKREIETLIQMDFIVICCGGGGIPVIREGRAFQGVDAVIDKDLASVCLAQEVKADVFVIATDVKGVMLNFGTKNQKMLEAVTPEEATCHIQEGQFSTGSMLPKVEACVEFATNSGKRAVITSVENIERAVVKGDIGTRFVRRDACHL